MLTTALRNASWNIRDHIALVRSRAPTGFSQEGAEATALEAPATGFRVAMEKCGSAKAPAEQELQVTPAAAQIAMLPM